MLDDVGLNSRAETAILGVTEVNITTPVIALNPTAASLGVSQRLLKRTRHVSTATDTWQKDDLAVCALRHRLHSLQIPNLHSRSARQNISSLSHQFSGLDFGACGDDLGFSDALGLGGHREGVLELVGEDYVFYEHGLDLDAPAGGNVFDDFTNRLSNLLATLDNVLEDAGTDDVAESGLGTLNQCLTNIADPEGGLVWAGDVVVDNGRELKGDIVLGHADLLWDLDNLDLDIDLDETLRERVDFDKTWVDGAIETTEFGDETDVALRDGLVWVGAADAAWDGAEGTNAGTESVD